MSEVVKGILRAVSSALQVPTIIILILLILLTIVMLGSFIAELVTERKSLRLNIPKLVDDLQGKSTAEMKEVIAASSLLTRQKAAAQELISRVTYPDDTREALARQLIADEEARYNKIIKITDLTSRVAPMFGLMGTLIPLGPGLIALGKGDAATLSASLLIAFDTTVAGLISGAISYVVSGIRKGWYEEYMIGLETIMETILDVQNTERRKAMQQKKAADAAKSGKTAPRDTITMAPGAMMSAPAYGQQAAYGQPQSQQAPAAPQPQQTYAQQAAYAQPAAQPDPAAFAPQPAYTQPAQPAPAPAPRPAANPQQPAAQPAAQPVQARPAPAPAPRPAADPQQPAAQPAAQAAAQAVPVRPAPAQAARPAGNPQQAAPRPRPAARPQQEAQGQTIAEQVTRRPDFAEANKRTIAGEDAARLQAEVRAAANNMQAAEEQAIEKELESIRSLDELLENFAPKDGRQ